MGCLFVVRHREVPGYVDQPPLIRVMLNLKSLRDLALSRCALRVILWVTAAEFAIGRIYLSGDGGGVGLRLLFLLPIVVALPIVARHRRRLILRRLWTDHRSGNA